MVKVEWVDTTGHTEWVGWDEAREQDICTFWSVGFLVQETDDKIQIAQTANANTVSNTLLIPKGCVKKIEKI